MTFCRECTEILCRHSSLSQLDLCVRKYTTVIMYEKYLLHSLKNLLSTVIPHPAVDLLTDSGQSSLLPLHIEQLHQRLDGHPLGAGENLPQ